MNNTRVIFMGTPHFACSILNALLEEGYNVVAVVSQPDKKVGRKQELQATPVKALALTHNIPVVQPTSIKTQYEDVLAYAPDLIVTCAYGQIVPKALLDAPRFGCINVHASLLPALRGGAPIHKSIIYGHQETGISIMRMVEKMDAGAYMMQEAIPIGPDDTTGIIHDALMELGDSMIRRALPLILEGRATFIEQDESKITYAWNVSKEEEKIDFSKPLQQVYDQVRGLIPWPVGYGLLAGKKCKIWSAKARTATHSLATGCLVFSDVVEIAVDGGFLRVEELQLEGKQKVSAKDFMNGSGKKLEGELMQ
ncbi:MAG: methionyl-tRNA formyltransferase [Erysipelotrichaceae bacterium]